MLRRFSPKLVPPCCVVSWKIYEHILHVVQGDLLQILLYRHECVKQWIIHGDTIRHIVVLFNQFN
jgi:hypothetical protein